MTVNDFIDRLHFAVNAEGVKPEARVVTQDGFEVTSVVIQDGRAILVVRKN